MVHYALSVSCRRLTRIRTATMALINGQSRSRHNFAPLGSAHNGGDGRNQMQLRGIVFDMDGTLCLVSLKPLPDWTRLSLVPDGD